MSLSLFHHIFVDNSSDKTLVLLHGTGGDEHDLLPIAEYLNRKWNVLSLRGNVNENGMNRFFKRLEFGVFDEENIKSEAEKLKGFIDAFMKEKKISVENLTYLGFSNGANMILAFALLHKEYVRRAVLLHPMMPLNPNPVDLSGKLFIVTYGSNDHMITPVQSKKVIENLKKFGANVKEYFHEGGHEIRKEELDFVSINI